MFFLDKPYVSDFLKSTLKDNFIPIVDTGELDKLNIKENMNIISKTEAQELAKNKESLALYCTSENSIGWIAKNLDFCDIPKKIDIFKDKYQFRKLLKTMFPNFYFKSLKFADFENTSYFDLPNEFIIKPSIGFMSMGVYKVACEQDWKMAKSSIRNEFNQYSNLYPLEVINLKEFIIEECINGDEYAIDLYFNDLGEPIILNILEHLFLNENDVGDRVYITSKQIIKNNLKEFTSFMQEVGNLSNMRNFPLHVELRRTKEGVLIPIEINPLRFGGWCTTADMAYMAYEFNPYLYYFHQKRPNWEEILKSKKDELYSIIVLDNSTGVPTNKIQSFDYKKLISNFEEVLELRKIDFHQYPLFGFMFVKTKKENIQELYSILHSDLKEFITQFQNP